MCPLYPVDSEGARPKPVGLYCAGLRDIARRQLGQRGGEALCGVGAEPSCTMT